jgi:aryl-alcohol dehydrogenase-like predicted oxidoreductase
MPDERRDQVLSDKNLALVERLSTFATERSHSLLELAISWLLNQPAVSSVIAGATNADQVAANVEATSWKMSLEELAAIDHIVSQV